MKNSSTSIYVRFSTIWLWQALFVLLLTNYGASESIIKNLPGFSGDLPFKLETGYVGLGDSDEQQFFYYFIESERSPENDPLLLWMTGGPRCSSFYGLSYEIGPISFEIVDLTKDPVKLVLNPYSWTKLANIIFLDAPAGTGFSYSTTLEGLISNDTLHATRAYEFLQRWLMNHPKFLANPLYISGDSYSGKIVPIIVQHITNGIDSGIEPHLNLKGYIIGNPATNTKDDFNSRIEYAHRMALISDRIYEGTKAEWAKCNKTTPYTFDIPSSFDYHRNLSQNSLRAIVYSGDHDLMIPYISTLAWIESLNLTVDDDWKPWFSDHQVAGYTIYYSNNKYNLTYATIKGGGHAAPEYKPKECFDMINRWLAHSLL